jgi:hypothetical protein
MVGDGTPSYVYDFEGWEKMAGNKGLLEPRYTIADIIHQLTPQARIILIFRDPVDRCLVHQLLIII